MNATNAIINAVYPNALDTKTCQHQFKKFKNNDFNLFDGTKSGRPVKFDKDLLAEIEADSKQTIQELAMKLKIL